MQICKHLIDITVRYKNFIYTIIVAFLLVVLAGENACAQNRNLSSGSFTAAGVPGAQNTNNQENTQNQTEVPVTKP